MEDRPVSEVADGRPEAMVERLRQAICEHDLDSLVECFTTDYVNETPVHPNRGFRGRRQVRRNWERIFAGVPDITATVTRSAVVGETIWSEWEMSGGRLDGSAFLMRGVTVFGVVGGLAAWCRFYLEQVDKGGEDIDAATQRAVTGASGVAGGRP